MLMSRRDCLRLVAGLGAGVALSPALKYLGGAAQAAEAAGEEAQYWQSSGRDAVKCTLCPRQEILQKGACGICRARQNVDGKLRTLAWNEPCVLNIDPVEQNPLSHVLPGEAFLAVAHAGCTLQCKYCQNWEISQRGPREVSNIRDFQMTTSLEHALKRKVKGITFTYTEPTTHPEFVRDMAALAKSRGLLATMSTCGYVMPLPFKSLLTPFHAVTITYKGASDSFYKEVCGGELRPVLEAMRIAREEKKWLEVATLVLPGLNDKSEDLRTQAKWIVANLGADTPWHLEKFTPMFEYKNMRPTPQATLERARDIGLEAGLRYVYLSNIAPHDNNNTYCPKCKKLLIQRLGFKVTDNQMKKDACPACGEKIPGLWA